MIKKLMHIIRGWGKAFGWIQVSTAEQKMSDARVRLCEDCELSDISKVLELMNGKGEYVDQLYCKQCKCGCRAKSLVIDEKCPINRW